MQRVSLSRFRPEAVQDLIRLGRDSDGGYLVSRRAVASTRVLISAGVADDWSFEEDFARIQPLARIMALDGSVGLWQFSRSAIRHLWSALREAAQRGPRSASSDLARAVHFAQTAFNFAHFFSHPARTFEKKFLGDGVSPDWVGLDDILRQWSPTPHDGAGPQVFLKVDIEGGEYAIAPTIAAHHQMISAVVIEWHDLGTRWAEFEGLMDRLLPAFAVAHLHGNNHAPLIPATNIPTVLEMTLLSRELMEQGHRPTELMYPLPLDRPCNSRREDYRLSFD